MVQASAKGKFRARFVILLSQLGVLGLGLLQGGDFGDGVFLEGGQPAAPDSNC